MYLLSSFVFIVGMLMIAFILGLMVQALIGTAKCEGRQRHALILAIPVGLGVLITMLFILALAGALGVLPVVVTAAVLSLGSLMFLRKQKYASPVHWHALLENPAPVIMVLAGLIYASYAAMGVSLEWDELSYHLPYARDYAEHGGLVVSEYLRFPLHSHNFHLLYAAALMFSSETATHLLHACCGILTAAGIVIYCREFLNHGIGIAASIIYLALTATYFDTAYVDLGLGMFVFFSFYSLSEWQKSGDNSYLMISAFLLAMAAGTKYQGLAQMAVFFFALLAASRSPLHFTRVALILLLFGSWWYLRNFLISGDPFHPMGGRIFGYWLWNEGDLNGMLGDVAKYQDHLSIVLVPAMGSVFLLKTMGEQYRTLVILGLGGLTVWYLTSRYDRYLIPTLPFLAILSVHVTSIFLHKMMPRMTQHLHLKSWWRSAAIGLIAITVGVDMVGKWEDVCFTRACVDRVNSKELSSHQVASAYPEFHNLKLYQLGFENEIYHLPRQVFGDWFGPYRYRDVLALGGDGEATARHLEKIGADSIMVNRTRKRFSNFLLNSELEPGLRKVYEDHAVVLYTLPE